MQHAYIMVCLEASLHKEVIKWLEYS